MSTRVPYIAGLASITLLLLTSLYYQYFQGMMPCPLCILQRIDFAVLGVLFLMGIFIHTSRGGRLMIGITSIIFSSVGILLAGRQVWLQHVPNANANECGVSLQYMMSALPLHEVAQKIFQGTAECTQRGWEFLHLNMAEWALLCFSGFLLFSIYLLLQGCKR